MLAALDVPHLVAEIYLLPIRVYSGRAEVLVAGADGMVVGHHIVAELVAGLATLAHQN